MSEETISEEQILHNQLSFEINQELIHLMKRIIKLQQKIKLLKHRLETANDYIESRIDNMIPEHYDDLKYIINECDLNSSW